MEHEQVTPDLLMWPPISECTAEYCYMGVGKHDTALQAQLVSILRWTDADWFYFGLYFCSGNKCSSLLSIFSSPNTEDWEMPTRGGEYVLLRKMVAPPAPLQCIKSRYWCTNNTFPLNLSTKFCEIALLYLKNLKKLKNLFRHYTVVFWFLSSHDIEMLVCNVNQWHCRGL